MEDIGKKITKARIKLFFDHPFYGNLTMGMKLIDATETSWCPTAAVDGRNIYYNRNFFADLSLQEVVFVLCHEVLHVALDHLGRRGHRDPQWWNMSTDYVINDMLIKDKIGTMPTKPVEDPAEKARGHTSQRVGLHNPKYSGWNSEKVYEDLEKRKVKKELTLDVHLELGNDGSKKKGGGGGDRPGDGKTSGPGIEISEDELDQIREEMQARVIQAAQAAHAAGKLPASIGRLIAELTEPVINWRELLRETVQSCLTDDFTWNKPNRRHMYNGIFMPTLRKDETVDVAVALDMSGSMTDDMVRDCLSEVYGLVTSYADFQLSVVCFDTEAYNYQVFTPDSIDDLLTYEAKGGGGTDFMAFWKHWQHNDIEPKKAVVFTDGYCGSVGPNNGWGPDNYCDTLWILLGGRHSGIVPPFGSYAYFEPQEGVTEVGGS
jgi:predicted metal-dependent peptidase